MLQATAFPQPAASPLRWWSGTELDAVRSRLLDALTTWLENWVPGGAGLHVDLRCQVASEAGGADETWSNLGERGGMHAWIAFAQPEEAVIRGLISGVRQKAVDGQPIARAVAIQADADLRLELAKVLPTGAVPGMALPQPALFRPWSGAVVLTMETPQQGFVMRVLLDGACMAGILSPLPVQRRSLPVRSPLVPLALAVGDLRIALEVRMSPVQITLGTLSGLEIDDVVRLPDDLTVPMSLVTGHGEAVCRGYLGRVGDMKAIELSPAGGSAAASKAVGI